MPNQIVTDGSADVLGTNPGMRWEYRKSCCESPLRREKRTGEAYPGASECLLLAVSGNRVLAKPMKSACPLSGV